MQVANTNVRNIGSIGGNLMLKHDHPDFPSDIFLLLETVGASLYVQTTAGQINEYQPSEWLDMSMDKKLLYFITLPALTSNHVFMSYKLTPRSENAHAYVNAAFLAVISRIDPNILVMETPNFVFGGLSSEFIHANATEQFVVGKILNTDSTLQGAMTELETEIQIDQDPILASADYRKHLAKALLYKVS
jgi:xanthine dehydrogenase/oxidase